MPLATTVWTRIATRYRIDDDRRAKQSASTLPAAETNQNDQEKRKPSVSPDRVTTTTIVDPPQSSHEDHGVLSKPTSLGLREAGTSSIATHS